MSQLLFRDYKEPCGCETRIKKKYCRITLRRVLFDQKEPRLEVIIEEQRTEMHLDALVTSIYLRQFSLCRSLFVFPAADAQVIIRC